MFIYLHPQFLPIYFILFYFMFQSLHSASLPPFLPPSPINSHSSTHYVSLPYPFLPSITLFPFAHLTFPPVLT